MPEWTATVGTWITPALLIALFAWLRSDVAGLGKRIEGLDTRLRAVEVEIGKVGERLAAVERQVHGGGE